MASKNCFYTAGGIRRFCITLLNIGKEDSSIFPRNPIQRKNYHSVVRTLIHQRDPDFCHADAVGEAVEAVEEAIAEAVEDELAGWPGCSTWQGR